MAIGDDAQAAGMPLVPPNGATGSAGKVRQGPQELNRGRDFIAQGTANWKPGVTVPTARIADGAVTTSKMPDAAVTKAKLADIGGPDAASAGKIPVYNAAAQLTTADPTLHGHAASKGYVDAVAGGGGLANGPSSAAYGRPLQGSNRFAVWMNDALEFMRGTSARKYKKNIKAWSLSASAFMRLRPVEYDRKKEWGEGHEVGFIADEVLEALPEAVLYFDGEVDGIDYNVVVTALVSHVQQLTAVVLDGLDGLAEERG